MTALQSRLNTLEMTGWADRSCDLAVNIVRHLIYMGQLKHLSIKHASLSEQAWKRVLQFPKLQRKLVHGDKPATECFALERSDSMQVQQARR